MTIKEFETEWNEKSESEFDKMFRNAAWYKIKIGGLIIPCIRLTRTKVGLIDGSVHPIRNGESIMIVDSMEEKQKQFKWLDTMRDFCCLEDSDKYSAKHYINLMKEKERLEKEMSASRNVHGDGKIHCSFCNKSQEEVKKLVSGPGNVYICDECIEICNEIMDEEYFSEKFEFRNIGQTEAEEVANIEKICFSAEEACTREMMEDRVRKVPELFLVAVDREKGRIAGFLNGIATDEEKFRDEFFTDASLHKHDGSTVMLLGLDVRPEYRRQGLAREIVYQYLIRERINGRKRIVLTCHEGMVAMYESFGFKDLGMSASRWGEAKWHEMERLLV